MPYITQEEAELNVDGFLSKTQAEKYALLLKSEAYISSKCVPKYADVKKVPNAIKQASYEVIRGTMAGKLFVGVTRQATSEKVKVDTLEVHEIYSESSVDVNEYEQLIDMLLAPYSNCGNSRGGIGLWGRI